MTFIKKIEGEVLKANKLRGEGYIEYCLWIDSCGSLYVQFEENDINTTVPGTFNGLLYPVSKYIHLRDLPDAISKPAGYNNIDECWEIGSDSNNAGFLKAVLRHLLATN